MDENYNNTITGNDGNFQSEEAIDKKILQVKEEINKTAEVNEDKISKEEKIENEIKQINLKQQYNSLKNAKNINEIQEEKNSSKYNDIKEKYEKIQEQQYIETEIEKCKKVIELNFVKKQYEQVIEWTKKLETYENEYDTIVKVDVKDEEVNLNKERLSLIKNENKILGFFKKVINLLKGSFERS